MADKYDYSLLQSCGRDSFISANVEIRRPHLVSIGNNVAIDTGFYCTVKANIGDYVHIGPYVTIIGGEQGLVQVGHFVTIAAGSRIICVSDEHLGEGLGGPHLPEEYRDRQIVGPVVIEKFAAVATNVVVLPGVRLAEGSVVGACSLVARSTEPWTINVGIPAKPVKKRQMEKMISKARALGY